MSRAADPPHAALALRLRLMLVTPGDRAPALTAALVADALAGGATGVLLREPQLGVPERASLAREVSELCAARGALLLVSRDAGLARAGGAGGVHTGWGGPSVAELRAAAPGLLVSRSAHWPLSPEDSQADLLLLSPFRPTQRSHPRPLLTAEQARAVLSTPGLPPTVALGGLCAEDVPALPAGLCGVAVIRAIADAADPRAAAARLVAAVAERCAGALFGPPRAQVA